MNNVNDAATTTVQRPRESETLYNNSMASRELLTMRERAIIEEAKSILARHLADVSAVREAGTLHMTSATAASDYLRLCLAECDREEFHVLYLNSQHQLLAHQRHSIGTLAAASVYPREVVKDALKHNAGAVILAHNHPSGSPEPSGADRAITRKLQEALTLVDVRVLDHIIVCGDGVTTYSFAEHGDV